MTETLLRGTGPVESRSSTERSGQRRAAVETSTHYLDTTGEQPYMKMAFERYGPGAADAEVAVIPAMGFDYAVGDCIARLASSGHEPPPLLMARPWHFRSAVTLVCRNLAPAFAIARSHATVLASAFGT